MVVVVDDDIDVRARPVLLADVLRTTADTVESGVAWAAAAFARLPGLSLVAVDLPRRRVALVAADRSVRVADERPGLLSEYYAAWAAGRASAGRAERVQPLADGVGRDRTD